MSKFICSVRRGHEMCRTNGDVGLQLKTNIYPIPSDHDIAKIMKLINDVIEECEVENET